MRRPLMLAAAGLCVFVIVAATMLKFLPEPHKESDYMVIGSVATLVALVVMFIVLISTSMRAKDVFFRRRKK
jgi:Na+/melibiose symporter-like transporter